MSRGAVDRLAKDRERQAPGLTRERGPSGALGPVEDGARVGTVVEWAAGQPAGLLDSCAVPGRGDTQERVAPALAHRDGKLPAL